MDYNNLILERKGHVAILFINREKVLNALNSEVLDELSKVIDEVYEDEEIHVLIVTGKGRAFVAGADISEMSTLNAEEARVFAEKGLSVFRKLETMEKPVIAAVNGFALGGGCELSLACDIRIASTKAKFGQPETGLGITPGFSGSQRLPRLVGAGIAKEMIYTAKTINAEEALKIGLVNAVYEPEHLIDESLKLAKEIAANGQQAVRYAKAAINYGLETDIETGMEMEKNLFGLCFATEDQKEGMKAFLENRKPEFKN